MSAKLAQLILLFEQLEAWDIQARQPIANPSFTEDAATQETHETPLERNMQSYQTLTTQIYELADTADTNVLDYLITLLHHKNTMLRMQTISALGHTGRIEAIEPLAALIRQETNNDVKAAVAQSLGFFGSRLATIPLIEILESDMTDRNDAKVRFACAQALSFIADPSTIDSLIEALTRNYGSFESSVSDLREAVRDALVSIGSETVVEKLIDLWEQPQIHPVTTFDDNIRHEIITAFGQIEQPKALDFLLKLAHDANSEIRETVMSALVYHQDLRAVHSLTDALGDVDPYVREAAKFSLQQLGKNPTSS